MSLSKKLSGLVLTIGMAIGLTLTASAATPNYINVVPRDVDDISALDNKLDNTVAVKEFDDDWMVYYSFQLQKPAEVAILGRCEDKETGNPWVNFNISENPDMSNSVRSYQLYSFDRVEKNYMILEAGTYYVTFDSKEYNGFSGGSGNSKFMFSIVKQDLERTGETLGESKKSAIALGNGESVTAIGSLFNTHQYIAFSVSKKAKVKVKLNLFLPDQMSTDATAYIVDEKGKQYGRVFLSNSITSIFGNGVFFNYLPAGKYYVKLDFGTVCTDSVRGLVDVSLEYKEVLKNPVVKSYKAKSKKIEGTAKQGTKIVIKVNKKTYKVVIKNGKYSVKLKSKLKSGDKITVYVSDRIGNKSKTVSKRVK